MVTFAILVGLVVSATILFSIGNVLLSIFNLIFKKGLAPSYYLITKITPSLIERTLIQGNPYYRNLPASEKLRFTKRVKEFMERKEFIGRQGLEVSEEMCILISASAIQITFGLEEYVFPYFSKILVFPKEYYSRLTGKNHKGEVNLQGVIAFSWEDFKRGYENETDNYNLGLHEMAHALQLNHYKSNEFDKFFAIYFDKWSSICMDEFERIKTGKGSVLRDYAGTNLSEFFSVCVEYFFESPQLLKDKIPKLYFHLCILLNQNPLANSIPQATRKQHFNQRSTAPAHFTLIKKIENRYAGIFSIWVGVLVLFISGCAWFISHAARTDELQYFLLLVSILASFIYLGKFKSLHFYKEGLAIKAQISIFPQSLFLAYENIISLTFAKNRMSDIIIVNYVVEEQLITKTYPYYMTDADTTLLSRLLLENNVLVKIPSGIITLADLPKEKAAS